MSRYWISQGLKVDQLGKWGMVMKITRSWKVVLNVYWCDLFHVYKLTSNAAPRIFTLPGAWAHD